MSGSGASASACASSSSHSSSVRDSTSSGTRSTSGARLGPVDFGAGATAANPSASNGASASATSSSSGPNASATTSRSLNAHSSAEQRTEAEELIVFATESGAANQLSSGDNDGGEFGGRGACDAHGSVSSSCSSSSVSPCVQLEMTPNSSDS